MHVGTLSESIRSEKGLYCFFCFWNTILSSFGCLSPELNRCVMLETFIGVDAGGTATRAVLADAKGNVLNCVDGEAANPHVHGISVSVCTVTSVLDKLTGHTSHESHSDRSVYETLVSVVVALSGADEVSMIAEYASRLRETFRLPTHATLHIVHDSAAPAGLMLGSRIVSPHKTLSVATSTPCVCVLIAGTGSVCSVFQLQGKQISEVSEDINMSPIISTDACTLVVSARAGGRGPLIGDGGSAYAIATGTLRRAMRICDGVEDDSEDSSLRAEAHEVLALCADMLNVSADVSVATNAGITSLAATVHGTQVTRGKIASLAQPLADAALGGNSIASDAFTAAAEDLARLVMAVVCHAQDVTVIGTGGVFRAWDKVSEFRETFLNVLSMKRPNVQNLWLVKSRSACTGAIGAARLGALVHGKDDSQWVETTRKELLHVSLK